MTDQESESPTKNILEQFSQEYKKSIPDKLNKIREFLDQLSVKMDEENLKALRMHIHKIAGSAGTYGFTKVSEISIKFEKEILDRLDELKEKDGDPRWVEKFQMYYDHIKEEFKQ